MAEEKKSCTSFILMGASVSTFLTPTRISSQLLEKEKGDWGGGGGGEKHELMLTSYAVLVGGSLTCEA